MRSYRNITKRVEKIKLEKIVCEDGKPLAQTLKEMDKKSYEQYSNIVREYRDYSDKFDRMNDQLYRLVLDQDKKLTYLYNRLKISNIFLALTTAICIGLVITFKILH